MGYKQYSKIPKLIQTFHGINFRQISSYHILSQLAATKKYTLKQPNIIVMHYKYTSMIIANIAYSLNRAKLHCLH